MRYRILLAALCILASGCTVNVRSIRFQPGSAVRVPGATLEVGDVRYIPAERRVLKPNQFEMNKAGRVFFDIPIADHLRRCITREVEASGMKYGAGGGKLDIEITRFHLADKFWSLELYYEMTWKLTAGGKMISRDLRVQRRRAVYTNTKKAEDMNEMATEAFEQFFEDPEVKALLRG